MDVIKKVFTPSFLWICIVLASVMVMTEWGYSKKEAEKRGYLGVLVDNLDNLEKEELGIVHGILVTEVIQGSPAEKAGIQEEDIIQFFDGRKIRRPHDLVRFVSQTKPDTKVAIILNRNGEKKDMQVTIGSSESGLRHVREKRQPCGLFDKTRPYMGVKLHKMNSDLASYFQVQKEGSTLILEVAEMSPAEKAGIKAGDILVKLNDSSVGDIKDVHQILEDLQVGDQVECSIIRKGKKLSMKVELAKDPAPHKFIFKGGKDLRNIIRVPEQMNMEDLHLDMEKLDQDMKDMEKEIQIQIKQTGEPDEI